MHDHEYFGWFLFALISFPAIYFAPIVRSIPTEIVSPSSNSIRLVIPILVLAAGPLLNVFINPNPTVTPLKDLLNQELQPVSAKRMPILVASPAGARTEYALTQQKIYLQIDQYQRVAKTDKLVPYMTRLYDNQRWTAQESTSIQLENNSANLTVFRNKTTHKNVAQLQWFDVAGITTHSTAVAKLLQIPALIRGKNYFIIITLQGECDANNCDNTKTVLTNTANSLLFNSKDN